MGVLSANMYERRLPLRRETAYRARRSCRRLRTTREDSGEKDQRISKRRGSESVDESDEFHHS